MVSGKSITHQLRGPVIEVTNRHCFTKGIPGTNIKSILYLEVEILRGERVVRAPPWTLPNVEKRCTLKGLSYLPEDIS